MIAWLGFALLAVLASAQAAEVPARPGIGLLVPPRPGVPVSLEQIEVRSRNSEDGTPAVEEVVESEVYRDSAGRLRIQSDTRKDSDHPSTPYADLIDPVAGSRTLLFNSEKIAYRMPYATPGEGKIAFLGIGGEAEPSRKWTARTETAGRRMIEGSEFEGTRIVRDAEGEPRLTITVEQWYSDKLKLIGAVAGSGPQEAYSARIQNLRHQEPDPSLFTIPADYKIIDLQPPPPSPQ
ncbi:MAG: hypothetical protein WCA49_04425 [Candidatus Sulfotelmatobacter sp.]